MIDSLYIELYESGDGYNYDWKVESLTPEEIKQYKEYKENKKIL